jgi:hypothetical protein
MTKKTNKQYLEVVTVTNSASASPLLSIAHIFGEFEHKRFAFDLANTGNELVNLWIEDGN